MHVIGEELCSFVSVTLLLFHIAISYCPLKDDAR